MPTAMRIFGAATPQVGAWRLVGSIDVFCTVRWERRDSSGRNGRRVSSDSAKLVGYPAALHGTRFASYLDNVRESLAETGVLALHDKSDASVRDFIVMTGKRDQGAELERIQALSVGISSY
jgi:hypothetical protein